MHVYTSLFAVAVCFCAITSVSLGSENAETDVNEYVIGLPRFDAVSASTADVATDAAVKTRRAMIADLLGQLREAKGNRAKAYGVYLLGEFRAKEAVEFLLEMIDFSARRGDPRTSISRWRTHPAQQALSEIGVPSVGPIVKALGKEENVGRRKLMLMVLIDVLGKDVTQFVLQKASMAAPDAQIPTYEMALKSLGEM